jgi:circadian clock protein KaiB
MPATTSTERSEPASARPWDFCLYVNNRTPTSVRAIANLEKICEAHLSGQYRIEVVDLLEHPERAVSDQIVAIPTVVRRLPVPIRKAIGDLSNAQRFLAALGFSEI